MASFSVNATLGDCLKYGEYITASCLDCHHNAKLDMHGLADKLGPDHGALFKDIAHLLKCSACGSKRIHLIYSNISTNRAGLAKNR
ncbi:hypothetical protein ABE527_14385 [Brucella sp. TWI432]